MLSNRSKFLKLSTLFLFFIFIIGCKHTKELEKTSFATLKNKEIIQKVRETPFEFAHLAAKAKVEALFKNKSYSFTTHIRWEFDEAIWMSFTMFGIEGYRILIQEDSFKMIDKLNNQYLAKPYSHFQELANIDITFNEIQQLLLGQMLFSEAKKIEVTKEEEQITLLLNEFQYTNISKIEILTGNIISQFIQDNSNGRKMSVHQENYFMDKSGKFPMKREISISDNNSHMNVKMEFSKIKTEANQEYPFDIPTKYKKID